ADLASEGVALHLRGLERQGRLEGDVYVVALGGREVVDAQHVLLARLQARPARRRDLLDVARPGLARADLGLIALGLGVAVRVLVELDVPVARRTRPRHAHAHRRVVAGG